MGIITDTPISSTESKPMAETAAIMCCALTCIRMTPRYEVVMVPVLIYHHIGRSGRHITAEVSQGHGGIVEGRIFGRFP